MGKASSAKKVARAARAGGSRRPGQPRALGFPLVIAALAVLGLGLVVYARSAREAQAEPTVGQHWHSAYGINVCGEWQPNLNDVGEDLLGIHTHGDGLIHIHPTGSDAAGANATLSHFFDQVGVDVKGEQITFPGGTQLRSRKNRCDGKRGVLQVARWASAEDADDGKEPAEVHTAGDEAIEKMRFHNDGEAFTVAFLADGSKIPPPQSTEALSGVSDAPQAPPGAGGPVPPGAGVPPGVPPGAGVPPPSVPTGQEGTGETPTTVASTTEAGQ